MLLRFITFLPFLVLCSCKNKSHEENKTITNKLITNNSHATLNSEGGLIILDAPQLESENEISKSRNRSVVARKGVVFNETNDIVIFNNESKNEATLRDTKHNNTAFNSGELSTTSVEYAQLSQHKVTSNETILKSLDAKILDKGEKNLSKIESTLPTKSLTNNQSDVINKTEIIEKVKNKIYKPTILTYEILANMNQKKEKNDLPLVNSSLSSIISNQILSPNEQKYTHVKTSYSSVSTSGHPGMVMPLVIAILVVPMFAILGYLAMKRGREAWKNRHYKRMDFLLDGMYND